MTNLNLVPSFTESESLNRDKVGDVPPETTPEEEVVEEKDTPPEPPAETKPDSVPFEVENQLAGLKEEKAKLIHELAELRGQKREIKRQEISVIEKKIDNLNDVSPQDVELIERVLQAKGYVKEDEVNKRYYDTIKDDEVAKFLEKYPEYKPENDKGDVNWAALQRELGFYRLPDNPRLIGEVLERAHRGVAKVPSASSKVTQVKRRQAEVASVGAGGTQKSSSGKQLDPVKRSYYLDHGWSEEDIKRIEENL